MSLFKHQKRRSNLPLCKHKTLSFLIATVIYSTPLHAQNIDFNLPSQLLQKSIHQLAKQSGIEIISAGHMLQTKTAPQVQGSMSAEQALEKLLKGSSLKTEKKGNIYVIIENKNSSKVKTLTNADTTTENEHKISMTLEKQPLAKLDKITIYASKENNIFKESNSKAFIDKEQLDRYTYISPADMLKGQSGVAVGDSRNGGGLDVNIRGVQGQSRVGVSVDGGEQMVNVYRGYSGTQQRSYVDPDLIRSIEIEKGSSTADNEGGYIGGTVRMHTLEPQDILVADKNFGVRIKGNLGDNSIAPSGTSKPIGLGVYQWVEPRDERSHQWTDLARSGSIATAWKNDHWELLAAYATRTQGNYFSGKNGYDRYQKAHEDRFAGSGEQAFTVTHGMFYENEEILNTSADSESILFKAKYIIDDEQNIKLGYRNYSAELANVMPSALQRYCGRFGNCMVGHGTSGLAQWEPGTVHLNAYNLDYRYIPKNNDLIDLKVGLWSTYTNTNEISGANPYHPFETKEPDTLSYAKMPQTAFNWGFNVRNESDFSGDLGEIRWINGFEFKNEYVKPQDFLSELTPMEKLGERVIRHAKRWESSLFSQAFYKPSDSWELRAGLRYTQFSSKDLNQQPEKSLFCPNQDMCMTMDQDPKFILKNNFDEYTKTAKFLEQIKNDDRNVAPSLGATYYFLPETFVYANYSLAYRMPSLFETSMGTANVKTVASLEPEQARNFELGFSTMHNDVITVSDQLSFKVAYFNNNYKNYISRFLDPNEYFTSSQFMYFTNLDKFEVSGFEMNAAYDSGIFFSNLTGNYFQKAKACDSDIAQKIRDAANYPYVKGTANTPNCVDGGFGSSYAAAQNPPKYSYALGVGTRLLDQKLTLGGRLNYTHSPISRMDKPWHKVITTYQKFYEKVQTIDLYAKYEVSDKLNYNLNITNLTDQYYLDALTQSYMPAPGRTVNIGFEYKF